MHFSEEIFKGYDIRGVYKVQFDDEFILLLGKALGIYLQKRILSNVVISNDGDVISSAISASLLQGLSDIELKISDGGVSIPQALNYFLATNSGYLGVYVSCGKSVENQVIIRATKPDLMILDSTDFEELQTIIKSTSIISGLRKKDLLKVDLFLAYKEFLKKRFANFSGFKLVLGLGDQVCRQFFPNVFESLGIKTNLVERNSFLEAQSELSATIKKIEPDLVAYINYGLSEFYVLGNDDNIYDNDKLLMMFADEILSSNPNSRVVFDVKSTELLSEFIKFRGGTSSRIKTGYPYFITELKSGAILGGEFSGNFYFKDDYYGYDDHIYTILRMLERVYETKRPLSYIMQSFPMRVHSLELKLPCPNDLKYGLIDTLIANFRELPDVKEIDDTDGVRVKVTSTGWFLIRASSTGPYLSIRIEGLYEKEALMIVERIKMVLTPFVFVETDQLNSVKLYVS